MIESKRVLTVSKSGRVTKVLRKWQRCISATHSEVQCSNGNAFEPPKSELLQLVRWTFDDLKISYGRKQKAKSIEEIRMRGSEFPLKIIGCQHNVIAIHQMTYLLSLPCALWLEHPTTLAILRPENDEHIQQANPCHLDEPFSSLTLSNSLLELALQKTRPDLAK